MLLDTTFSAVCLAFLPGGIGPMEMIIIGVIAVLLFGSRLPDVARSMGKSLVEFKKGMRGIEDEVSSATNTASTYSPTYYDPDDHADTSAPKFEPPQPEKQETSAATDAKAE